MLYRLEVGRQALKEVSKLPTTVRERVIAAIERLGDTPRPPGCKPVKNTAPGTYRIRVGDYRIVYLVRDNDRAVIVARVTRRNESAYRGL